MLAGSSSPGVTHDFSFGYWPDANATVARVACTTIPFISSCTASPTLASCRAILWSRVITLVSFIDLCICVCVLSIFHVVSFVAWHLMLWQFATQQPTNFSLFVFDQFHLILSWFKTFHIFISFVDHQYFPKCLLLLPTYCKCAGKLDLTLVKLYCDWLRRF